MAMKATAAVGDITADDKERIAETLEAEPGVREYGFSDDGVYAVVIPDEVERKQLLKKILAEHGYDDPDCERTEV